MALARPSGTTPYLASTHSGAEETMC